MYFILAVGNSAQKNNFTTCRKLIFIPMRAAATHKLSISHKHQSCIQIYCLEIFPDFILEEKVVVIICGDVPNGSKIAHKLPPSASTVRKPKTSDKNKKKIAYFADTRRLPKFTFITKRLLTIGTKTRHGTFSIQNKLSPISETTLCIYIVIVYLRLLNIGLLKNSFFFF